MTTTHGNRDDVRAWFTLQGWSPIKSGHLGELWTPNGDTDADARIGIPWGVADDKTAFDGVVKRAAHWMGWDPRDVEHAIRMWNVDVTRIRSEYLDVDGVDFGVGAPLAIAGDLLSGAERIFRAATTTSISPRALIGGRHPADATALFKRIRAGYTEHGSYVLPIYVPLDRPDTDGSLIAVPSRRRDITQTVAESLAAIRRIIIEPNTEPGEEEIRELVHIGVSREFISGVSQVVQSSDDAVTSFAWAASHATLPGARRDLPTEITIESAARVILERAAQRLKAPPSGTERLEGKIRGLAREEDGGTTVTLATTRNGRDARVDLQLGIVPDEEFDELLHWFGNGTKIATSGVVERLSGTLTVKSPAPFAVHWSIEDIDQ